MRSHLKSHPALLHSAFIYDEGTYPQIHATTIAETPAGLVAAWFGGVHEKHPDVGIWVSRLIDGKWTESVEVANGIQYITTEGEVVRHPAWNPVLFQPKEGPLLLFYKVGPNACTWWGMLTRSHDNGETWEEPHRLPEGILGPIKNKPVQLADGTILCPTSMEVSGKGEKEHWFVYFESTKDFGKTWQRTEPLHEGVAIQAIQPSLLFLGGEKLLAIGRTRQDKVFEILSEDGGKTWGRIKLGTLPNNNSGTDAVTLQDGRHLIVYNHVGGTPGKWGGVRTPLNLSVSKDGVTWEAALILEDQPGEFSYPAIIQTRDGNVHITYTWNRTKVKYVVIDPRKLTGEPMIDGQWPVGIPGENQSQNTDPIRGVSPVSETSSSVDSGPQRLSAPREGIFAALWIPTCKNGALLPGKTARHLRWLQSQGVHGVLALASTGEFARMEMYRRREILAKIIELAAPLPVIVNVSSIRLHEVISLGRTAKQLGAVGVALMPPPFFPLPQKDILEFFLRAAEKIDLPFYLYNYPEVTGNRIGLDVVSEFADRAQMVGIKQSGGELGYHDDLISLGRQKNFSVFTAADPLLATYLDKGATGCLGGLPNFVPEYMLEVYRACRLGKSDAVAETSRRLARMGEILSPLGLPMNVRSGMEARGLEPGELKTVVSADTLKVYDEVVRTLRQSFAEWELPAVRFE